MATGKSDQVVSKFVELRDTLSTCDATPPNTGEYAQLLLRLVNTWRRVCDPSTAYHEEAAGDDDHYDTVGWLPPWG